MAAIESPVEEQTCALGRAETQIKLLDHFLPASLSHPLSQAGIVVQSLQGISQCNDISGRDQNARLFVVYEFRNP